MATVRVSSETRERLLKLQARMQLETGRRRMERHRTRKVSMDDVIVGMLDHGKSG